MRGEGAAVWGLALGQTLIYAGLYYGFAALLPDLLVATGWSKQMLAAGPTLAFLVTAVLTPFTGRLVDRGLGGEMLILLPILGALGLAGAGFAGTPALWLVGWAVVGLAQAGSLYDTCFAFITRRLGEGARIAITRVTLVAGFASTLAFPLGHWLGAQFGGRGGLAALALVVAIGAVPVNLWAVRRLRRLERAGTPRRAPTEPGLLAAALRRPLFWLIAVLFGVTMLNHGMLITYALVLFADRGAAAGTAVLAASCIGPSQVAGRLILMLNEARIGNLGAMRASLGAIVLATGALWLAGAAPGLIFAFALLQGAGIGLTSILRPVLLAEKLGRRGFGVISGAAAVAPILAIAAAPTAGAVLLSLGGVPALLAASTALTLIALSLGALVMRQPSQ
ncbi:MFS transporter [Gemmobacter lutimaris]|uniref:MFS transporter n=1 Tax=Gemmobacter lutimaris TaxID=2306023 RepID=A0A398BU46_9RHOB|nr:MFS transporter [Gemmobacter lutimaris]RID93067.1 MFS transporter [Gemmobacter lutimaris]